MATYEIQTENGTYQIETEDPPQQQAQAQPQQPAFNPADIKGNLKQDTLSASPIIPSVAARLPTMALAGLQYLSDKLSPHDNKPLNTKYGPVTQMQGSPIVPRPSGLLVEGQEIPTVGQGLLSKVTPSMPNVPKLPSYERASQNFNAVQQAAGDMPVDVSEAGDHALRIQEMAGRGGSQPKVVRDFVTRATAPNAKPLTYSELRDFASNASRLSADEAGRLTPAMKREMGAFAQSLNKANEGAAEAAGVGDKYRAAMNEYRNAARLNDFKQGVKDVAKSQAIKTVGGGLLGYEALHKLGLL